MFSAEVGKDVLLHPIVGANEIAFTALCVIRFAIFADHSDGNQVDCPAVLNEFGVKPNAHLNLLFHW